ncbi:hypothetical protein Hanom_Chr16g01522651 [Helianthus anomalus]
MGLPRSIKWCPAIASDIIVGDYVHITTRTKLVQRLVVMFKKDNFNIHMVRNLLMA